MIEYDVEIYPVVLTHFRPNLRIRSFYIARQNCWQYWKTSACPEYSSQAYYRHSYIWAHNPCFGTTTLATCFSPNNIQACSFDIQDTRFTSTVLLGSCYCWLSTDSCSSFCLLRSVADTKFINTMVCDGMSSLPCSCAYSLEQFACWHYSFGHITGCFP